TEIGWHHEPASRNAGEGFYLPGNEDEMATVVKQLETRTLVPVVRERLADLETPVSAFAKLRPLGGAFLLESVEGGERMGRYSFIGVMPRATLVFRDGPGPRIALPHRPERRVRTVTANGTPEQFRARVSRARELIVDGDCIQIVVAQRFDVRPAPEPLALYRALRHVNPSPYMFLIEAAGTTLVGASPEPFVRVEDGRVVMHPIAGTRPRGRDDAEDA